MRGSLRTSVHFDARATADEPGLPVYALLADDGAGATSSWTEAD